MKNLLLCLSMILVVSLAGCGNQNQGPKTPCDTARAGLTIGVLGANAYFIAYPEKATPEKIARVQGYVNDGYACVQGLCADPNNPTYDVCIKKVLAELGVEIAQGPITTPITIPITIPEK